MKASALKYIILSTMVNLIFIILVVMPFHAFLTVWLASGLGHYTALRLWKEVLLLLLMIGGLYLLLADHKIRTQILPRRLIHLIVLFLVLQLVAGVIALHTRSVSLKALGYGLIVDCRFLAFFLITWAVALRTDRLTLRWQKLILPSAAIVAFFALLQAIVLPPNFLSHFGYGAKTIAPFETINHNVHYIRVESTLRGANPLGAYMLIPISLATVLLLRLKKKVIYVALLISSWVALFLSFSRAAWIGAGLSFCTAIALGLQSRRLKLGFWYLIAGLVVVTAATGIGLRHNLRFQNLVFHTQTHSQVKTTSDQGHLSALKSGLLSIVHKPLGEGPGSAGPASVYNNHPARIAENFYVQIGQETGWLGIVLFLLINAGVGYLLWLRRSDPLALGLLASFVGLSFVNLLSHAWADDTLAYVWWGLAGISMARSVELETKPIEHVPKA